MDKYTGQVMFTFSVTVILYKDLMKNALKSTTLLGNITLAWLYAFSESPSFSKNLKEKHICGTPCTCKDQGLTHIHASGASVCF